VRKGSGEQIKLVTLSNLAVAALIFGQFTTQSFRFGLAIVAIIILSPAVFYGNHLLPNLD
jgi:hypothetical protein